VYVHEIGAPHVVDPERLLRSASRLYDDMDALWGPVLPVPEANVRVVGDGDTAEGLDVIYTPGHASHHVAYLDPDDGDAFTGDAAGVRIPPQGRPLAPTPPPEIDVESWHETIARLRERSPRRLLLTHFGAIDDPGAHLDRFEAELDRLAGLARDGDRESFVAAYQAEIDAEDDDVAARMREAVPPEHVWLGLERYWRKRA
jgi:glyoxylase-like metal-dependent hydrolase (beta-lactamase superfamily II)